MPRTSLNSPAVVLCHGVLPLFTGKKTEARGDACSADSQPGTGRAGREVSPSALAAPAVPPTPPGKPPPMALHLNVLGSTWRSCMWARAAGPAQAPVPTLAFTVGIHCSSQSTRQSHWNGFPRRSLGQEAGEGLRPGFQPAGGHTPRPSPGKGSG